MEAMWNKFHPNHPPNATWSTETHKIDTANLLSVLKKAVCHLNSQNALHTEAAVLSRLIYRMKSKFRGDKGLKNMEKVNRALLNYLALSLDKEYEKFRSYIEIEGKSVTLPSRQMLEYILVRTQGFAKLMVRIEEVSRCSATFFQARLHTGHAWLIAMIAYAVVSRIWFLSRELVKKACNWYATLYKYHKDFESVGLDWLSEEQELPFDLKVWLGLSWISTVTPSVPQEKGWKHVLLEVMKTREDLEEEITEEIPVKETESSANVDDIGEVISRSSFQSMIQEASSKEIVPEATEVTAQVEKKQKSKVKSSVAKSKKKEPTTLKEVETQSDLTMLLSKEFYPGLDKLRWNIIKNKSRKLLSKLNECPAKKQKSLLRKVVKRLQEWIDS